VLVLESLEHDGLSSEFLMPAATCVIGNMTRLVAVRRTMECLRRQSVDIT